MLEGEPLAQEMLHSLVGVKVAPGETAPATHVPLVEGQVECSPPDEEQEPPPATLSVNTHEREVCEPIMH